MARVVICRWVVLVAAVFLGIWPATTRAAPVARVVISHVDTTHLPEVRIVLSALDGAGAPITGLGQASFQVLEDGNAQKITSVGPATEGMTVVLAIDTSGSMANPDAAGHVKIDEVRKAAEQFVNTTQQLNAGKSTTPDLLSVISFSDQLVVRDLLLPDPNAAINAIRSLKAEAKWTALYDAAFAAVKIAGGAQPGQRAVILFTDGVDEGPNNKTGSKVQLSDVIALAEERNVPIYTIGVGRDVDDQVLGRLATLTGGAYAQTNDASKLTPLLQQIATLLKTKYAVAYNSAGAATDHTIQVRVQGDGSAGSDNSVQHFPPIPPYVGFFAPKDGDTVQGEVDLVPQFSAYNQRPIIKVEYRANGQLIGTTNSEPWILHWDSSQVPPGHTELAVTAIDSAGLTGTSPAKSLSLTVQPLPTPSPSPVPPSPSPVPPSPSPVPPSPSATEAPVAPVVATVAIVTPIATVVPPPPQPLPLWRNPLLLAFAVGAFGLFVIVAVLAYPRLRRSPPEEQLVGSPVPLLLSSNPGGPTMTFASLTVIQGPGLVDHVYPIAERAVIGRDPTCEVYIDDWTKSVSRQHAEIRRQDATFVLYDLGSLNGTRVGAVVAKRDEGIVLTDDAEIALGNRYVLKFSSVPDADDRTTRPIPERPRPRHERRKVRERWEASRAPRR